MTTTIDREHVYAKDWGYDILIDMGASVVGATSICFFITDPGRTTTKIDTGITIVNNNFFKWTVPKDTTNTPGSYKIRPQFELNGWTGSGDPDILSVEKIDEPAS